MDIKNTTLDDIASVIGFSATLRLSAWFGDGSNLYVPNEIGEDHVITKLIGISAASRLSKSFGKKHLALPRISSYENDVRRRIVCRLLELRMATSEIAQHLRMTERRVQQIARDLEVAGLVAVIARPETPVETVEPVNREAGIWGQLMR